MIEAELLKTLNMLYSARSSRISAVQGHIPEVIWWIIFMGGVLTVGYTYLFGFHNFRMHLVTTTVVSTSLALVIVLIIALDWPFRGKVSVTADAFVKTEQSWSDLSFTTPAPLEGQEGGDAPSIAPAHQRAGTYLRRTARLTELLSERSKASRAWSLSPKADSRTARIAPGAQARGADPDVRTCALPYPARWASCST